ncbi:MAG: carboxylesterase family protein [Deltaproteobacteria bacterium]|nr:carboxylesterase family protein [Deltaproteobacteria bacterium]
MRAPKIDALALCALLTLTACGGGEAGGGDGGQPPCGECDGGTSSDLEADLTIDSGPIHGVEDGDLVIFRGVPYAEAPVGALRFRKPVPVSPWTSPRDATAFGPPCVQRDHTGAMVGDEDCLTVNIWAPRAAGAPRPVMVFIHGGAFLQGSANLPVYDGASIARTGEVVVVTLQYRLGALGFFVDDALLTEESGAGNQGIRDQQLALDWVQRNAAFFGGNPGEVTIFGESAGGISVCAHLGAPSSDGLYARAIVQSGTGCYGMQRLRVPTVVHVSAISQAENVITEAGCQNASDALACLRALPATTVIDAGLSGAANNLGLADFGPVIDQVLLSEAPFDRVRRGERSTITIVSGANADEGKTFTQGLSIPDTATYESTVRAVLPLQADEVLALYPASAFASPKDAYDALLSDLAFICPALSFAEAAGEGGGEAYSYHFTHTLTGLASSWGSFHALELWYLFDTLDTFPSYSATAADQRVSLMLREAWTDLAHGRTPLADLPWLTTTGAAPQIGLLADPPSTATEIRGGRCDGLEGLGLVRAP